LNKPFTHLLTFLGDRKNEEHSRKRTKDISHTLSAIGICIISQYSAYEMWRHATQYLHGVER